MSKKNNAAAQRHSTASAHQVIDLCGLDQPLDLEEGLSEGRDWLAAERALLAFRVAVAKESLNEESLAEYLATANVYSASPREVVIQRAAYLIGIELGRRLAGGAR